MVEISNVFEWIINVALMFIGAGAIIYVAALGVSRAIEHYRHGPRTS